MPAKVTLKDPKAFKVLGQPLARLDVPEKVNGKAEFGIDVKRPGMLVARVVRRPVFGGKVASFNADKAKAIPGVRHVVQISTGIAVVADGYWAASRGAQALEVKWDEGPLATLSSAAITKQYAALAQKPGAVARNEGDADAALSRPGPSGPGVLDPAPRARIIERVFEAPFLAHACMEPMNCTAHVQKDRCDVWAPTQSQTATQQAAMGATGLPESKVFVHTTYIGGGFGRRASPTSCWTRSRRRRLWARRSKRSGRARTTRSTTTTARSPTCACGGARCCGHADAWKQRIVQSSLLKRLNPGALDASKGVDGISVEGAANLPYEIPNLRVEYIETDPGIPYGFWRSVGSSVNGYVTEAFIDELATTAGKDPYQFRRALLRRPPRHRAVLDLVAEKAAGRSRWRRAASAASPSTTASAASLASSPKSRWRRTPSGCTRSPVPWTAAGSSIPTRSRRRWKAASSTACPRR